MKIRHPVGLGHPVLNTALVHSEMPYALSWSILKSVPTQGVDTMASSNNFLTSHSCGDWDIWISEIRLEGVSPAPHCISAQLRNGTSDYFWQWYKGQFLTSHS